MPSRSMPSSAHAVKPTGGHPASSARERALAAALATPVAGAAASAVAQTAPGDQGGHLARLPVLGGAFLVAAGLNCLASGFPHLIYVVLGLVLLISVGMVIGSAAPHALLRLAVPLLDLAWLLFAMRLADGAQGLLLPLLYVVVAAATVRGRQWEVGATLAGAITGTFALVLCYSRGLGLTSAVAQISLLAASTLAVRLMAVSRGARQCDADPATAALYENLAETTSDAVFTLDPETWHINYANPAAMLLCGASDPAASPVGKPLDEAIHFSDKAFLKTCRKRLAEDDFVRGAVTTCEQGDATPQRITVNMSPARVERNVSYIQVVASITDETAEAQPAGEQYPGYDFACHYIPALTHELNNHLAIIRLSAEVASATGRMPDFSMIQQQVDHCQEVLQAVVVQVMRASTPTKAAEGVPTADLGKVIEHSLLLTRPQVLAHGIQLQLALPAPPLPRVMGHVYELQEALVRIILYAVEAMEDLDQPRLLSWHVVAREDTVELTLADLGPGLKWGELAAINGSAAPSRGQDRVWKTVREGITRFGGTLAASNGLNGGARFRITLKMASA